MQQKFIDKFLNLIICCIIFLIPLAFFLPCHESFEMPKSTVFYVFTFFFLTFFIIKILISKKFFVSASFSIPVFALLFIFSLSFIKSIIINKYASSINWQFLKLILFNIILYLIIINIFNRKDIIKFICFLIFSHFIVVFYGILQYFGIDFIRWISFGEGRVYSTMGNPDYMAAQFSILIPLIITLILSPLKNKYRYMLFAFLILMLFLIIVSHGRGAWLGFLGSLFYMFIMYAFLYGKQFFIRYKLFFVLIFAFIVFLILIFSFPNPLNKNPITNRIKDGLKLTSDSVVIRLFYWESALQMAKDNPLSGVGVGGFSLNTPFYQKKVYDRWLKKYPSLAQRVAPHVELYTHNDFLQTLAETGFSGLGIYLWLFFTILIISIYKAIKEEYFLYKSILLGITGAVIAFLINGFLNFPWRVVPTLILLWILFSIFSIFENKKIINLKINFNPKPIILLLFAMCLVFSVSQLNSFFANICIKTGQSLFANGRYEEARQYFEKALSANPRGTDKIELVLYAGNAYNSLNQIDKAIFYYNEGLKMFPNFIEAHYNIGNVYMNNNMIEKAVEEYEKVLALNPKFINAMNNLANIYFAKNEFEKAMLMYKKALEIKPDNPDTRFNLSASYFRLKQYDRAYLELKKILEYAPDYQLAKEWIEKMNALGLVKLK